MIYYNFFKFGENIFSSSARGECPACEIFNFEILYLAEAPAGNYPPAKYRIPNFYIRIGRNKLNYPPATKTKNIISEYFVKGFP